jgi:hypothetical protein
MLGRFGDKERHAAFGAAHMFAAHLIGHAQNRAATQTRTNHSEGHQQTPSVTTPAHRSTRFQAGEFVTSAERAFRSHAFWNALPMLLNSNVIVIGNPNSRVVMRANPCPPQPVLRVGA